MAKKQQPPTETSDDVTANPKIISLIERFGWTLSRPIALTNEVRDWLDGDAETPDIVWRSIDFPNEFKNQYPIAAALFRMVADFLDFIGAASHETIDRLILEKCGRPLLTEGCPTPFGIVFTAQASGPLQIWFGRKSGRRPDLEGAAAMNAVHELFGQTYWESIEYAAAIPAVTAEQPKSTHRRTLATPPTAANITGPGMSKQTRMIAKKQVATKVDPATGDTMQLIDIDLIVNDKANRKIAERDPKTKAMAENIRAVGLLQPITVRPLKDTSPQRYMITAGERRWRACQLAGLKTIPCIVRETAGVATAVSRLSENLMRENLTPIELATEYSGLIEAGKTQKQIGELFGVTQAQISNTIRLLKLPANLHPHIGDGEGQIAATTIRPALAFFDLPCVVDAFNELLKSGGPFTPGCVEDCLSETLENNSRSMKYEATLSSWMKPQQTQRHFKTLSVDDSTLLDVREIDGEERAFNLQLFHKLNKEPFQERLKKFNANRPKSSGPAANKAQAAADKKLLIQKGQEWTIDRNIGTHLRKQIAAKIGDKKTDAARAILTLAIKGLFRNVMPAEYQNAAKHAESIDALTADPKTFVAKLQPLAAKAVNQSNMNVETCQHLAKLLNLNLTADWKISTEIVNCLTEAGVAQCVKELELSVPPDANDKQLRNVLVKKWPAGAIPLFLLPFFRLPKPATQRKSKAA
jgi:ParB/RepB/Spo0J family partition protein